MALAPELRSVDIALNRVKPKVEFNSCFGALRPAASLRKQDWLLGLLLLAATLTTYQPAWHAGFIWDDDLYVTANPLLTAPDGLKRIWFSLDSPSQYWPLVYTSFRIERQLWDLNSTGYHLVNILLHAANAVLVWRLLRRLAVPGAWLAAALFALHPVQVESVAWITERKNVLSLLFYLLALLGWVGFVQEQPHRWRRYAQALCFYVCALLSKTTACTLPAALLLVLWLRHQPISRLRLLQVGPFVALGLGMGLLTMWWEKHHQGTSGGLFDLSWLDRLLIASRAAWFYAGKLLWPANLTFSYPRWTIDPADPFAYAWLAAGLALCAAILLARRCVGRSVETAGAFYLAALSPLLGFIMLYTFRYSFVADHYQYMASIGPLALLAAGITLGLRVLFKENSLTVAAWCAPLVLLLGTLTWHQCATYINAETLYRTTIARNPNSFLAHHNLGDLLLEDGRTDEAIAEFRQALRIEPTALEAQLNLADALLQKHQPAEALPHYEAALAIEPRQPGAHLKLAGALQALGRSPEAVSHYRAALQLEPGWALALNNLAWILATHPQAHIRNGAEAVRLAEQACHASSYREAVYIGTLAAAYAEAGRFEDAVTTAEKARALADSTGQAELARKNKELLDLYRARQPYHEPAA
jgi:protein O-mannosyl-transferase